MSLSVAVDFEKLDGTLIRGNAQAVRVPAGTGGTWILRVAAGAEGIPAGSRIVIQRYNLQIAHRLQTDHPRRRDYLTAESRDGSSVSLEAGPGPGDKQFALLLPHGAAGGERIEIRIGDRRQGGPGSEVFWSTTTGRLHVEVSAPEGERRELDYRVEVVSAEEPALLRLLGPTTPEPGEPFDMNLVVFDRGRNVVESFTGTIRLTCDEVIKGLSDEITFTPEDRGIRILKGVRIEREGVYRVGVSLADGSLPTRSNPLVCRNHGGQRIWWGDLHNHAWGDCSMLLMYDRSDKIDPASRHDQARRVGRFDYAAPGPMAMPPGPEREEIWEAYREAFRRNDEPGSYVPFLAMELHPPEGDRTLVFAGMAEVPIEMRSPVTEGYRLYGDAPDAILEVHIGGAVPRYDLYRPERERLVEVASAFANAEWLLQEVLSQGWHPAVTGASDLHLGLLGAPRAVEPFRGRFGYANREVSVRDSGYGNGPVGALMAASCGREEFWQAIQQRSGYVTTGERIYLRVQAAGYPMGSIAPLPNRFELLLEAHGREPVERIDLIMGDRRVRSWFPGTEDVHLRFVVDREVLPRSRWFYFRLRQRNGEYAWSAPIWFSAAGSGPAHERPGSSVQQEPGRDPALWPFWNQSENPRTATDGSSARAAELLNDLEGYLEAHGDRGFFQEIEPVGIFDESMGRCARFLSRTVREQFPVMIRWFFEFDIPRIRVDWGYEDFGVINCQTGPPPVQ